MKKIITAISMILCTNVAFAVQDGFGDQKECYIETHKRDSAWFCGKHNRKCKQKMKNKLNKIKTAFVVALCFTKNNPPWAYALSPFTQRGRWCYTVQKGGVSHE